MQTPYKVTKYIYIEYVNFVKFQRTPFSYRTPPGLLLLLEQLL